MKSKSGVYAPFLFYLSRHYHLDVIGETWTLHATVKQVWCSTDGGMLLLSSTKRQTKRDHIVRWCPCAKKKLKKHEIVCHCHDVCSSAISSAKSMPPSRLVINDFCRRQRVFNVKCWWSSCMWQTAAPSRAVMWRVYGGQDKLYTLNSTEWLIWALGFQHSFPWSLYCIFLVGGTIRMVSFNRIQQSPKLKWFPFS